MATIHKEIEIDRSKEFVWDAIRDVGAIHKRPVPGFVVDCKLEGDWQLVSFGNGLIVRELIVSIDDMTCRYLFTHRQCAVPGWRLFGYASARKMLSRTFSETVKVTWM
jgi:hypothetical protein